MQIVTTREFRANQKKYFELAERETVFVSRKNARPIVISVADDDDFLSKEELLSIQKGLEDIKNGRTYRMQEGESLIPELQEHPYTGTGHSHQLRHVNGIWSRKLDKKNRLRYMVNDTTIVVLVLSAIGHYDDK